jgi:hypothetical protein
MKKFIIASVAASALLAGCGGGSDTPERPEVEVSEAQITEALTAMSLNESDAGMVAFEGGSQDGNDYVFTDVVMGGEDGLLAERLVIGSPRMGENGDVLMQSFSIENASSPEGEDGRVSIDRIYVTEPSAALSTLVAGILSGEEPDMDLDWSDVTFDAIAIEGINGSGDGLEELRLGRYAFEGFDGETLGRFELIDFALNADSPDGPVQFSLDEVSADNFKVGFIGDMIEAAAAGASEDEMMQAYMEGLFSNPAALMEMYDSVAVRGLDVNIMGIAVTLDEMTGDIERNGDQIITTSEIGSLIFRPSAAYQAGAQIAGVMDALGYEQFELSMGGESVFDEGEDRAYTRGDNFIEIRDAVRFEFESDATGMAAYMQAFADLAASGALTDASAGGNPFPPEMMQAYSALTINRFSITIDDQSILERGLTFAAAQQGLTAADLRAQAVGMVSMGLMSAPPMIPRDFLSTSSEAVTNFIQTGGALTITMAPEGGMSITDLQMQAMSPDFDFNSLGLSITHSD